MKAFQRGSPAILRGGTLQHRRAVRTSIYRTDPEFLDPNIPLLASERTPFIHSDDGYFVKPIVERSNPGMALLLLNLDRKPSDGGHGADEARRLEHHWRGESLYPRLRRKYKDIGIRLEEKERQFGIDLTRKSVDIDETLNGMKCLTPVQQMMTKYLKSSPLSLMGINLLYTKLRNNEVNSFRRVVVLSSVRRSAFADGLNKKELLFVAESSQLVGQLQPYGLFLLRNLAELAWILSTYTKPLLGYCEGMMSQLSSETYTSSTDDDGASLCLLTNHSAIHHETRATFDPTISGLIPLAGASHILSRLPSGLGKYLALTGQQLTALDLIHVGAAKYWIAPEAIPFMELTSESQLEVSEHDAAGLIREHILEVPNGKSGITNWLSLIGRIFGNSTSLEECVEKLTEVAEMRGEEAMWASDCLTRMRKRPLLAQTVTFSILTRIDLFRHDLLQKSRVSYDSWQRLQQTDRIHPTALNTASEKRYMETLDERTLELSLQLETRAASRLLMMPETLERLRFAACQSWRFSESRPDPRSKNLNHWIWPVRPHYRKFSDIPSEFLEEFFSPLTGNQTQFDFIAQSRTPFPLSQHPWIKEIHPDFNRRSKLDYDPMTLGEDRWKIEFLSSTRRRLLDMLTNPRSRLLRDRTKTV